MLKNFKYYAGLVDADAYLGLSFNKSTDGTYLVYTEAAIGLRWDSADKVLPALAEEYRVSLYEEEKKKPVGELQKKVQLRGSKGVRFLEQIKNHLVLKRGLAEYLISMNGKKLQEEELPVVRARIKELRADRTLSKKDYPSRQWFAGYIDGDGCFTTVFNKDGGLAFRLCITSHRDDPQGIELIRKAYGGSIYVRKDGNLFYYLTLKNDGASDKLFEGVLPHIKARRAQADYVRSVLRSGSHLKKNGATYQSNQKIRKKLQELKRPKSSEPQRLSEITPAGEAIV